MRFWPIVIPFAAVLAATASQAADAARHLKAPEIGRRVANFAAIDPLGVSHGLSDVGRDKILVLAFVGVDCPMARLYTPRLAELANKYQSRGVVFLGVDSNRQDAITAISAYSRNHHLAFTLLKDLKQRIANQVGATRTPQVVILDRDRRIRYRGRIDDQYGFVPTNRSPSYHKPQPNRRDLEQALDELLSNKPISQSETAAAGCLIGRDREPDAHSDVTYSKDVAPILNKNCVSCHRTGQIAPFSLTTFDEVAGWADMIAEVAATNRMPPWHADPKYGRFANEARLRDADKEILAKWAAAGAPEGDPKDLPEQPKFADGWMIPNPDEIIFMRERPFSVPATGVVRYQNFVVDPGWAEERWLSAVEARPGNPSVVHHILVFVIPPGGAAPVLRSDNLFVGCYTPGVLPAPFPPHFAFRVPAGSKLFFEIHYTPNGLAQEDRSCVGVRFADPRTVQREVTVSSAFNAALEIPPGAQNYEVRSQYVFKRDTLLLTLMPHMHLRGKDFLYEVAYPSGQRETLLSVPHYDFGWQTYYRFVEPKFIPQGTVLNCVAHYDNSESNLNNPNSHVAVRWGNQTFDEMMHGLFEATAAEEGVTRTSNHWPLALTIPFSTDQILALVLAAINVSIVSLLLVRMIRARLARANKSVPR